jgi:hypothetical protein
MTAVLNAAATAGKDGTGSLLDRFKIQQHGFHTAKSRLNWSQQTRSWGTCIYTTFSHSLGRVASEPASLRGGVRWSNLPISTDILHISPLLAGARLSPGRVNFLCRSCVETNALENSLF